MAQVGSIGKIERLQDLDRANYRKLNYAHSKVDSYSLLDGDRFTGIDCIDRY